MIASFPIANCTFAYITSFVVGYWKGIFPLNLESQTISYGPEQDSKRLTLSLHEQGFIIILALFLYAGVALRSYGQDQK